MDLTELQSEQEATSDAADAKPSRGRHQRPETSKPPPTGPPTSGEWQDFLGGVVLRMLTEGYLSLVLWREIDESELTDRERNLIRLTKDDLHDMASPMASFASKNKYARKHGRAIIAAAESYEALVDLFIWMRRVNKIAAKHRKPRIKESKNIVNGEVISEQVSGTNGQAQQAGGFQVFNRGTG
jgi:hypothetical protein